MMKPPPKKWSFSWLHLLLWLVLRLSSQVRLEFHSPSQIPDCSVAPLLFIPFVENAFKHGVSYQSPSDIQISLEVQERFIYFVVENSKHPRPPQQELFYVGGIGIQNVKKRLALLYPHHHVLKIEDLPKRYRVELMIDTSCLLP
jgi:LytS/YehU family sensor histidine kinase